MNFIDPGFVFRTLAALVMAFVCLASAQATDQTAPNIVLYFGTDVPNDAPYCFIENDRTVGIPSKMAPVGRGSFSIAGPAIPAAPPPASRPANR